MNAEIPPLAKNRSFLPYTDTKDEGAAGFYLGINATFRFIRQKFGYEGLIRYWQALGSDYFRPVTRNWRTGGLPAVAEYWKAFFAAEPNARVDVETLPDRVTLSVRQCPIIHHIRQNDRTMIAEFCEHCYWISESIGRRAGISVHISGGNGSCRQEFLNARPAIAQNLKNITRCS